ncbi:MAG: hypothetical protein IPM79_27780 [Polyangiaceae bacterium]|jgi:hypothetical protein|nr:hypothetical protein [Polyangiaceae bacterium]MBK6515586.1 hypothetical protein [Polyangiaceae bacterium]MBK8941305.1 hypothetical protein [Polyangiaceae bacterium]
MMFVYLLSAVSGLYGLMWLVFTFIEPPYSLSSYFRPPSAFYFVPDKAGRFLMFVLCAGVIPFFASFIVGMFVK